MVPHVDALGKFVFKRREACWFAHAEKIFNTSLVELSIEIGENALPAISLVEGLESLKVFIASLDGILELLYKYVNARFETGSPDKIKEMYLLSGITLKADGKTFWVVLEPSFDVKSKYNFFLRFTFVDGEITWSNLDGSSI